MAVEDGARDIVGRRFARAWRRFVQGWSDATAWPAFAWLRPDEPVRVVHPDGTSEGRLGATTRRANAERARSVAFVLPEDIVLTRDLDLPDIPARELATAIALHAEEASPFAPQDTAWGWQATTLDDGRISVRMALASRAQVAAYIAAAGHSQASQPEIWADGGSPVVLQGFGEAARRQRVTRQRRLIGAVAVLLVALLAALAWTPVAIQQERAADARARLARLAGETETTINRRDEVVGAAARIDALRTRIEAGADVVALLDTVTRLLPDSAYLTRMEVEGRQARITGFAQNATHLIETLGRHADLSEVRTPTAIARNRDGSESFSVEFRFDGGRSWQ